MMRVLLVTAAVLTLAAPAAIAQGNGGTTNGGTTPDTARDFAPGQQSRQPDSGPATDYAPGQIQKRGEGTARENAPGQLKKQDDTTTGTQGTNPSRSR